MSNNEVLCTCYKCIKFGGRYVSPSTRWRHTQKEKSNPYISNDLNLDDYKTNNSDNNEDVLQSEDDDDGEEVENDNDGEEEEDDDGEENDNNNNVLQSENRDGEAPTVAQMDTDDEYEPLNDSLNNCILLDNSLKNESNLLKNENDISGNEHDTSESEDIYFSGNRSSDDGNILWEEELYSDDDNFDDVNSMGESNEELSESFIKILRLLYIKHKHNLSDRAFNDILKIYGEGESSLYFAQKKLADFINVKPIFIPMCINSCCAFTDQLADNTSCLWCGEAAYINGRTPRKVATFLPLLDRFKLQYNNPRRSTELRYRYNYVNSDEYNGDSISDIFDGDLYKELVDEGHFKDERDIALIGSTDGFQIFKQKTDDCWAIMFINANLPPNERVKKENLLISAIIPGPNQPKNFNSFLRPIVDELKILEAGVTIFDSLLNENFTLRCYVILWTGDIPALTKIMHLTGHNSYFGCRFCYLKGIYCQQSKHIYYPCHMPENSGIQNFDPLNLPKRTPHTFERDLLNIENESQNTIKQSYIKNSGVSGRSILTELQTISFPKSFPIDIMHLFFENIAINMFKHWSGNFYKRIDTSKDPSVLSKNTWKEIGEFMHSNRKQIPLEFGRPLRNIQKHHNGFKATEWSNWITMYSLPLLSQNLPRLYLEGWSKFVMAVQICLKWKITNNDLKNVQSLLVEFFIHYETCYYKKEQERLSGMLISFHYLLHVSECIENCGPCWSYWQYPMERLCGILLPLVHSRLHPYNNLTNNILLLERFNHLAFVYPSLFDQFSESSTKSYSEDKVFSLGVEEFYWPKRDYNLTVHELKQLKHFYSILFNIPKKRLENIKSNGRKFGRLRTKDGHVISSFWIKRRTDIARNNYFVAVKMYEDKELFGKVEYFFVHEYLEEICMLAYIQWTSDVYIDRHHIKTFKGFSRHDFIEVDHIDRCVGFMRINDKFYIFDKEHQAIYVE